MTTTHDQSLRLEHTCTGDRRSKLNDARKQRELAPDLVAEFPRRTWHNQALSKIFAGEWVCADVKTQLQEVTDGDTRDLPTRHILPIATLYRQ